MILENYFSYLNIILRTKSCQSFFLIALRVTFIRLFICTSLTINSSDTSFSKATQMDYAIPASKIAALSSGEFVGMVADNPDQKISLKMFHSAIQNNHEAIAKEEAAYKAIPIIDRVSEEMVMETYNQIKADIA